MKLTTFSRKTIAIAVAAGLSLGGVTVAAPTAGAVGGYTPEELFPQAGTYRDNFAVWGYVGGYVNQVKTKDGYASGFSSGSNSRNARSIFTYPISSDSPQGYYSNPVGLGSLMMDNASTVEDPRDLSTAVKKVIYTAAIINNDIVSNNGLSDKAKQVFINAGYKPEETEYGTVGKFGENYGLAHTHKPESIDTSSDDAFISAFTQADSVAVITSFMVQQAMLSEGNESDPITSDELKSKINYRYSDDPGSEAAGTGNIAFVAPEGTSEQRGEDAYRLWNAFLDVAASVPDEAVATDDVKVRYYVPAQGENSKWNWPWLIDFDASTVPSIDTLLPDTESDPQPEPETPATDLHITDVKKLDNGNYEVTRSDDKTWTIDLADLNKRVADLEAKDTVSPAELKSVQDELDKAKKDIAGLKSKDSETDKALGELREDLNKITPRVDKLESRVDALEKSTIKEVKDNGDGTYTLIREDGTEVKGKIDTSGSVSNVKSDGKGNLVVTIDGEDKTVPLEKTTITETNKGKPNHTVTITTADGNKVSFNVFDKYVADVKKLDNGNYEVTRSDGKTWTIDLADLNKRVADLEAKDTVSPTDVKNVQDELDKAKKDIDGLKSKDSETDKDLDGLREDLNKLEPRVDKLEKRVDALEDSVIKEVKDNGDGTYTLIRKDGSTVKGTIDTGDNITKIVDNGDGSITVTHADGTTDKVTLAQTTVTETNKGTPRHTVTITTADGKKVSFNVFDTYVTDVKKLNNGNYEVTRNDGTKWTIDLKDIRDQIADLEDKEHPSKAEFDKVKKQLSDLTTKVNNDLGDIDDRFTKVEGDITNLRSDLTKLEKRVTKIESRLTKVEGRTDALTKCIAGAGTAGIPALLSVPLLLMTQLNIPGIKDLNTQVQKQIGIFNPQLSRQWERSGGVLQAGAALAGLAGMIGGVAYIANQCNPMMKTDAAKETDLGKLSSKIESGSSKDEAKPKDK